MLSSSTTVNARLGDGDPLTEAETLIASGKPEDAVRVLETVAAAGRGGLLLQEMRVSALAAAGLTEAALVVAREATYLYPNIAVAAVMLGGALMSAGHLPSAIGEFQRALRLDPTFSKARFLLGCAWLEAGEPDRAQEAFIAIPRGGATPELTDKLNEVELIRTRPRADARYVRHLFDQFSADYDVRMLGELHYGAPTILRDLAEMVGICRRGSHVILDLGCGTGLAGAAFADIAKRLDGIDLSPHMIAKAKERGIYDALVVDDIETGVSRVGEGYDLVLAADTLVYLGDLALLFESVASRLEPRGSFLLTVERKEGEGYELGPKRRWRHSAAYLRDIAAAAGFDVAGLLECEPRTEAGVPVEGYAAALAKA